MKGTACEPVTEPPVPPIGRPVRSPYGPGVRPILGRTFLPALDQPKRPQTVSRARMRNRGSVTDAYGWGIGPHRYNLIGTSPVARAPASNRSNRRASAIANGIVGYRSIFALALSRAATSCARNFAMRPINFTGTGWESGKRMVPLLIW